MKYEHSIEMTTSYRSIQQE